MAVFLPPPLFPLLRRSVVRALEPLRRAWAGLARALHDPWADGDALRRRRRRRHRRRRWRLLRRRRPACIATPSRERQLHLDELHGVAGETHAAATHVVVVLASEQLLRRGRQAQLRPTAREVHRVHVEQVGRHGGVGVVRPARLVLIVLISLRPESQPAPVRGRRGSARFESHHRLFVFSFSFVPPSVVCRALCCFATLLRRLLFTYRKFER
mmetsp:Transcript_29361/g.62260  ORF Transcript_29361/g.62260 Transcript_29361/m.62260 type:complete len:213 (-) Transcript_29361:30-668(-)